MGMHFLEQYKQAKKLFKEQPATELNQVINLLENATSKWEKGKHTDQHVDALTILLKIYSDTKNIEYATRIYNLSCSISPKSTMHQLYINLLITHKHYQKADKIVNSSLKSSPNNPDIMACAAMLYGATYNHDAAIYYAKKVIDCQKHILHMLIILFSSLFARGNYNEMLSVMNIIINNFHANTAIVDAMKINKALYIPYVLQSPEEYAVVYKKLLENIEQLTQDNLNPDTSYIKLLHFAIAYHGIDCLEVNKKIANLFLKIIPNIDYTAKHCNKEVEQGSPKKKRIGIFSECFSSINNPIIYSYKSIIDKTIVDQDMEVFIFSTFPYESSCFADQETARNHYIYVPENLDAIREMIASYELDVLIYTDIGMQTLTYLLAFSRLAHTQCMYAGHPVTSAIPNMDYFFVHKYHKVKQEHYTEKLYEFKNIIAYCEKPELPKNLHEKDYWGLDLNKKSYVCPMDIIKIHPSFDNAIARILQEDINSEVVLFQKQNTESYGLFKDRIKQKVGPLYNKIKFLDWGSEERLVNVLLKADVVLDSFPFGGGSTSSIMFAVGVPVVTLPTEFLSGRSTYGQYMFMGVEDLIAYSEDEYVKLAIKLANDKGFHKQIMQKILDNNDHLYANEKSITQLHDFMSNCNAYNKVTLEEI